MGLKRDRARRVFIIVTFDPRRSCGEECDILTAGTERVGHEADRVRLTVPWRARSSLNSSCRRASRRGGWRLRRGAAPDRDHRVPDRGRPVGREGRRSAGPEPRRGTGRHDREFPADKRRGIDRAVRETSSELRRRRLRDFHPEPQPLRLDESRPSTRVGDHGRSSEVDTNSAAPKPPESIHSRDRRHPANRAGRPRKARDRAEPTIHDGGLPGGSPRRRSRAGDRAPTVAIQDDAEGRRARFDLTAARWHGA